jgi:Beta-propeller repeat
MKRAYFVCLFQCLTATFLLSQSNPAPLINQSARVVSPISSLEADPKTQSKILDSYGKLPLSFEANHGQTDGAVKFFSRTGGYTLFLTSDEAVLAMRGKMVKKNSPQGPKPASLADSGGTPKAMPFPKTFHGTSSGRDAVATEDMSTSVLRMKLRNSNPAAKVTGLDELAGTSNYFIGNDPAKWRTNVPTYAKVKYEGVYSGIDLVYYGTQQQLEYDFIVAPGADPRRIEFDVRGAKRIRRDEHGDLVLKMRDSEIRWHKPVVYQEKDGTRREIAARYTITGANRVGFDVTGYDASRPLYIDPLIYSTYLGGSDTDSGYGITVDSEGNAYVTGITYSTDFPTKNPLQAAKAGGFDAFVAKINPTGSALVYSTYLGGSDYDQGKGIAVDSAGNAYVTGATISTDFPTMNPLQPAYGGGQEDAFVAKINPTGSALVYSTYLGGSNVEEGDGIAVDSAGNAHVTGVTGSNDFPTKNPLQPANGGYWDTFVAKLNPSGSALVYSTYLGGNYYDQGRGIALDSSGKACVTGQTSSTDFPTTPGAFQTVCSGGTACVGDVFVAKMNAAGSALVYSTYLGGSDDDRDNGIAVDSAGNAYVTGQTESTDFPTKNPLQPT